MATRILTQERLKELLHYDPDTGVFVWRVDRTANVKTGNVAGRANDENYWVITLNNKTYKAHRIAWLYMTGKWPSHTIDHIDRNPTNNCFSNLREATQAQNGINRNLDRRNKSGVTGVTWCKKSKKWRADIGENGKVIHLGRFDTLAAATEARKNAEDCHSAAAYIQRR
jgi:hypothetical protein